MTGTLKGVADNGSSLQISSFAEFDGPGKLSIESQHHCVEICEGLNKMVIDGIEEPMNMSYQSDLTGKYVEDLLSKHSLPLASYEESANLHQQILPHFLQIYNQLKGIDSDLCPIT